MPDDTNPKNQATAPRFPISASQFDSFKDSGGHMRCTVNIQESGAVDCVIRIWEDTALRGFRGAVAVAVTDQNANPLWVSPTKVYGVDGGMFGTHDRTENWSAQVPTDVLHQIRKVAIIQQWNPKNAFDDIEAWLNGLESVANQIKPIAQDVAAVAAVA
jgi:hypothetical protein